MINRTYEDKVSEELFYLIEAEKLDDTELIRRYQKHIGILDDVKQMLIGKKEHPYNHNQLIESRHVLIENLRAEEKVLTMRKIPHEKGW